MIEIMINLKRLKCIISDGSLHYDEDSVYIVSKKTRGSF